jgi:tetratricopeptide (TPR) repeat protein
MFRKYLFVIITTMLLFGATQIPVVAQPKPPNKKQIEKATKLANEGDTAFGRKNYRQAINKYYEAIGIVPKFARAYYNKGYAHYYLQEFDQSVKDLSAALNNGHNAIDVFKIRGFVYYQQKDFKASLIDSEQGLKLDPANVFLYLLAGDAQRGLDDFRAALALYKKAAELDPQNANTNYFIAFCHNQLREYAQQGVYAQKAIDMASKFKGESYDLLGQSLLFQKKYAVAVDAYEKALAAMPNLIDAYTNLGDLYRILNRYDDAIAIVQRGIKLYPNSGSLWVSLGWFHSLANNHKESVEASAQAVKLQPNEHMGWTNMCRAYNDLLDYPAAVKACETALNISPNDGETHLYLGLAYAKTNKADLAKSSNAKAVTGLVEFTKNNPDYSDGFYLLGNAYYRVDLFPKSISAYQRCLELSPNFVKARFNLGSIYAFQGDKVNAQRQYTALLKLDADLAAKLNESIKKMK